MCKWCANSGFILIKWYAIFADSFSPLTVGKIEVVPERYETKPCPCGGNCG